MEEYKEEPSSVVDLDSMVVPEFKSLSQVDKNKRPDLIQRFEVEDEDIVHGDIEENKPSPIPNEHYNLKENPVTEKFRNKNIIGSPVKKSVSILKSGIECFKYIFSCAILCLSVIVVMASLFTSNTHSAKQWNLHPIISFIIFWVLIIWLAAMEGGQGCLVGLQNVDKSLYAQSHPISSSNTSLAHEGNNMERFIIGRQFLVVLVVFLINTCGRATEGTSLLGLPKALQEIFLAQGVGVMLTTIIIGHLTSQINAAVCMLDFINNHFITFTVYVSLFIEFSGLLHSVYLFQIIFSKIIGVPVHSHEPSRNTAQNIFFWGRVLFSLSILLFAFAVTIKALFDGNSGMWNGIPNTVSVIIFFVLLAIVGIMEGMQIAAFALLNMPKEELASYNVASANCNLIFAGSNLQSFLIGRQIFVASLMLIVARVATLRNYTDDNTIFGVSAGLQKFLNTGLLGAIILAIVGSLAWRIIASSFPLAFMSNPAIYLIIRVCLLLNETGICSASWVLARLHKITIGFQPDEVYLEGSERHTSAPITKQDKEIDICLSAIKYLFSSLLLVFSIAVVMSTIFARQSAISKNVHPIFAFILFWSFMIWLATMEGGQGCLVGLRQIDKSLYAQSHPITLKNTTIVHEGNNMERFIIGRQFLVVLVIFLINMCCAPLNTTNTFGLQKALVETFSNSGLAMMLTTIIIGQLTSQINAAVCMLDFINNHFMLYTVTYITYAIEFSGLLHSVYLFQIIFSKMSTKHEGISQTPRNFIQALFFWGRVLFSLSILLFAFAVTIKALFDGNSGMWNGIPSTVSVIIFFVLLAIVGIMEGMQIAAFALLNMPKEELASYNVASANCNLMFAGSNLQSFLIGRQIFVTILMFIVARVATLRNYTDDNTIFGVSAGLQKFLNTGLLGAIILAIVGSLAWRIIASSFPLAFMSNPAIYLIIRVCLLLNETGICSVSWLLAFINKQIAGYQLDTNFLLKSQSNNQAASFTKENPVIPGTPS